MNRPKTRTIHFKETHQTLSINKALPAVALLALVAGCATTASAPTYDANGSAASQANTFIDADKEKHMKGVAKVGVLSCNVMFGMTTSASAATSKGTLDHSQNRGVSRADVKVSVTYTAKGVEERQLQRIADSACQDAEKQLGSAGFQLVPHATIKANKNYQEIQAGGRASPFECKGKGGTRYLVLARTGESVTDSRYIGAGKGLAQSFKSVSGKSSAQLEAQLMKDLDMTGVNINLLVDFAELQGDGHKTWGGFGNKDNAKVSRKVELSVSGDLRFQPLDEMKCARASLMNPAEVCSILSHKQPVFATKQAVASPATFYSSINNVTTTGDKVTSGLTKGLGMLMAFGGQSNKLAQDISRYQVNLLPDVYQAEIATLSNGLIGMAVTKAAAAR